MKTNGMKSLLEKLGCDSSIATHIRGLDELRIQEFFVRAPHSTSVLVCREVKNLWSIKFSIFIYFDLRNFITISRIIPNIGILLGFPLQNP